MQADGRNGERRGVDRRVAHDPNYQGEERRVGDRRVRERRRDGSAPAGDG